jgi:hypothetical protein
MNVALVLAMGVLVFVTRLNQSTAIFGKYNRISFIPSMIDPACRECF